MPTMTSTMTVGRIHTMFCDRFTRICVGTGRELPRPSNIVLKIGTMKVSMMMTATTESSSTITG